MPVRPLVVGMFLLSCLSAQSSKFVQLPLSFEANQGQSDAQVKYLVRGGRQTLFLTANQAVLNLVAPSNSVPDRFQSAHKVHSQPQRGAAIRMSFRNSRQPDSIEALDPLLGKVNYLISNDSSQWHTDIPTYGRIAYHGIYPGIDLVYYGTQGRLEYDFIAQPGADTNAIQVQFEGADAIRVADDGDLILDSAAGQVRWKKPDVYQDDHGVRRPIAANYRLGRDHTVEFALARYDRKLPLVIDPTLVYSTYLDGTGINGAIFMFADSSGMYCLGDTYATNFPTRAGAWQTSFSGEIAIFAAKLNPQGSMLLYSTYLGGSSAQLVNGAALYGDESLYLVGPTTSEDFPTTASAYQRSYGRDFGIPNETGFVTHLSATFNSLVFSTFLGGDNDDIPGNVALDPQGNVYIAGITASGDYPLTPGAFEESYDGLDNEGFVTKLNAAGSMLAYSTYLGGPGGDEEVPLPSGLISAPYVTQSYGVDIAVDSSGYAYVGGVTDSCNFPTTNGAYLTTNPCSNGIGYVVKLNTTGTGLVYGTLLGGTTFDAVISIRVDSSGSVMVAGVTASANFPTTPGAYQRTYGGGAEDGFVARLDPTGSKLTYSTFFGGAGQEAVVAGDLASNGDVVLSGLTYSSNLPTTQGASQSTYAGAGDTFLTLFNPTLSSLIDSTYIGTPELDDGTAFFGTGPSDILLAVNTFSTSFTTTPGAIQRTGIAPSGDGNAVFARFSEGTAEPPALSISKSHTGNFTQGQQGATYTVTVSNALGAGNTTQTVTVTENVPSGLTLVSMTGSGWSCSANTCTRSDALAGESSYTAITVTVNVASNASSPQVNSVSVSGGGSASAGATDSTVINTSVVTAPVLSIAKSHTGNFVQGQQAAPYSVVVSNSGTGPTTAPVLVTENVPSGLSLVSMNGNGWTCPSGGTTCSRSDLLAAGASYPAISVSVNVASSAASPQVNSVTVSGGGAASSATATDSTVIVNPSCSGISLSVAGAGLPATGTSTVETCPNNSGQPNCGVVPEIPASFHVTPGAGCGAWTATSSNPEFLQITSGGTGTGAGTVDYVLLNNTHNGQQTYTIALATGGQSATYTVTEAGSGDSEVYREVYALYEQLLGRDPDSGGFAFWTGAGGAELGQMADSFLTSPEAFNSDFAVMAAYQAATGAAPTFAQYNAGVASVRAGTQSIPGLFSSLTGSGFTMSNLYQNLLGRAPGPSDSSCTSMTLANCFQAIIGYPSSVTPVGAANNEFQSTGSLHTVDHTNALYAQMIYYVTLSRNPDPSGLAFWIGVANSGGPGVLFQGSAGFLTRIQILGPGTPNQGFIGSPEFQGLFAN